MIGKNYNQFGNYIINVKMLFDNYLLIKYKSNVYIKDWGKMRISNKFSQIIFYFLKTGEFNYDKIKALSLNEKELFEKLIKKSGLTQDFDITKIYDIDELYQKLELIQGEINAGNDNKLLRGEAMYLIKLLLREGKISQVDADEILEELKI